MCGYKRIPYGSSKNMTPEERLMHKRFLAKRWRDAHPEEVKRQNNYYKEKYFKERPFEAICKRCGKSFFAPRKCYRICLECQKKPTKTLLEKIAVQARKELRSRAKEEAILWYEAGLTQQKIAEGLGFSQKTISNWVKNSCKKK